MEKENLKTVGADASVRPTTKARQKNGITLIALVITIIVMLILVAVTITMAVNGGLFNYAGKAATQTNEAIEKEQELANLEANMTVDELIDKYTGKPKPVDPNFLNIGDYVNYPVEYTNVATLYESGVAEGYYPRDEFTGWRVLSKETDEQGNILYVKLISAGVPLSFYSDNTPDTSVQALTTNFLTTEITSTYTKYKFYKHGFTNVTGATLESTFANEFTDKVQALTKTELDKVVVDLGGSIITSGTYVTDSIYKDLLAVPCKGNGYAYSWLATSDKDEYLWHVNSSGSVHLGDGFACGVRPVVSLKSGVQFTPATVEINETTTWDISI